MGKRGQQLNLYLTDDLAASIDRQSIELTKQTGREYTRQDVLKIAFHWWNQKREAKQRSENDHT